MRAHTVLLPCICREIDVSTSPMLRHSLLASPMQQTHYCLRWLLRTAGCFPTRQAVGAGSQPIEISRRLLRRWCFRPEEGLKEVEFYSIFSSIDGTRPSFCSAIDGTHKALRSSILFRFTSRTPLHLTHTPSLVTWAIPRTVRVSAVCTKRKKTENFDNPYVNVTLVSQQVCASKRAEPAF